MSIRPLALLALLAFAAAALPACGGNSHKVDTDSIRKNADDADRDLDRESQKHQDQ